jgi:hypothetical protein
MPSKARPVYLPPPDFPRRALSVELAPPQPWVRVHPIRYAPIHFSRDLDMCFSPPGGACGVLYLGSDEETCIMEKFGDIIYGWQQLGQPVSISDSRWSACILTEVRVPALRVCDLTQGKTLQECGVDTAALVSPDLSVSQAWAAALMDHHARFDALRYRSRFTQQPCLAVFDRAPAVTAACSLGLLSDHDAANGILAKFQVALI